jgi:hypothetical protein
MFLPEIFPRSIFFADVVSALQDKPVPVLYVAFAVFTSPTRMGAVIRRP